MKQVLNQVHNLMMNCTSLQEFQSYSFEVYYSNKALKTKIKELFKAGTLAAEHTKLPMYYLAPTVYGMKQDRFGKFYKAV